MRRNASLAILGLAMIVCTLVAAPQSFLPLEVTQPDGSRINIYASGDEFHNWLHDEDNFTIVQDDDGAYVYAIQERGSLAPSDLLVGRDRPGMRNLTPGLNLSPDEIKAKYDRYAQMRDYSNSRAPHTGQFNNIVIFIKFSDSPEFSTPFSYYQQVFNDSGETDNSMKRYFQAASYNQLNVDSFFYPAPNGDVVVSYTDTYPRSYFQPHSASNPNGYSGHTQRTEREQEMLARAVNAVGSQIPSTLNIDGDNDGYVDNVCFIIQGQPDGWAELLWPHRWVLFDTIAFINNKRVWDFNFQLESFLDNSGASVLAHEMFHSLGAPDLYRYYNDIITPIGRWDLMASGLNPPQHMSVWMKHEYGEWVNNVPTINTSGTYNLHPVASSSTNNIYRINSWHSNEYYLLEYRKPHGIYDANIPGTGLLVYRLDTRYEGNANGPPDELYIYRPDGTNSVNGLLDLAALSEQSGRTEISEATAPNGFLGNSSPGGLNLFDVGVAGDTISFKVKISDIQLTYPHGGETWISGDNKTITWVRKNITGTVKLEYSSDGGQTWNLIATGMGNTGSYTWNNIPSMNSSNEVHVRVTHLTTGQSDSNYYPFTVIGGTLPPPSNLTATVQDQNVSLSWQAPVPDSTYIQTGTRNLLGYNVYRNGTLIATVTTTNHLDENLPNGSYTYIVTASYTEGESAAASPVTVFVGTSNLPPPTDLHAIVDGNTVILAWAPPSQPEEGIWISWCEDEMCSSIGTGGAVIFDVAHRFTQADLASVSGGTITKVNFVPHEPFCTYTVKVWTGGSETDAGTLVHSQGVPNPVMDEWNTVILAIPVPIPATGDVYIGYECNAQAGYPAACDFGPPVTGKGDMINFDGAWTPMSISYNLFYNWLIQTFVDTSAGRVMLQPQPIAEAPRPNTPNARIAKAELPAPITLSSPDNACRQLLGYSVYRDDNLIATINQTSYSDTNLPFGTYSYFVTANYDEGESGPAGPITITLEELLPPSNLQATVEQTSVNLTWEAPAEPGTVLREATGTRQPLRYKVYRDCNLIATIRDPDIMTYTDKELPYGTYTYGVSALYYYGESQPATIEVTVKEILGELIFGDDFESYPDFDTAFYPWHLIDEDQANTSGIPGVDFPGSGSPMAYTVFNPSATVPPLEGLTCYSGNKMAACFSVMDTDNSDYLISPTMLLGTNSKLRFFARSHPDKFGLARFRVGVSAQPTISTEFEWLDATYVEAPTSWTEYIYDLNSYNGSPVRIAIHCQSSEAVAFYVDDFAIHSDGGTDDDDNTIPVPTTRLEGNYPNPFNPSTTIRYSLGEAGPVTIGIYNLKGQLVCTLINEVKESGSHSVTWNGLDQNNRAVSSGVYLFRMKAGRYSHTRKMIMLK